MPQVVTCDSISHSVLESRACQPSANRRSVASDVEEQKIQSPWQRTAIKNTRWRGATTRMCHPISSLHVRCDTALSILLSYIYCFASVRDVEMPLFDRAPPFNSSTCLTHSRSISLPCNRRSRSRRRLRAVKSSVRPTTSAFGATAGAHIVKRQFETRLRGAHLRYVRLQLLLC